ncbi:MAG: nuclear transport factor 2 family protein [Pseudobacteriovorax sp.]|nr:nuclear transport factor 2 family protein [Pseudobacteriovorax sp.]
MTTTALSIGEKLVGYCKEGKEDICLKELYAENAHSIEPDGTTAKNIDEIRGKHQWWAENFEVHSGQVTGPFPHGDRFAVIFDMDTTNKQSQQRSQMKEVGLYTVEQGKIVKEEFFYAPE